MTKMACITFDSAHTVGQAPYAIITMPKGGYRELEQECRRLATMLPNDTTEESGCPVQLAFVNLSGDWRICDTPLEFGEMLRGVKGNERGAANWIIRFQRACDSGRTWGSAALKAGADKAPR